MLKYFMRICFFLLPLFSSTTIQADCLPFSMLLDYQPSSFYVGVFGGYAGGYDLKCTDFKTNRGYYLGFNTGKKVFPNIRWEGDIIWQRNDVKSDVNPINHVSGAINMGSVMTNAILDFNFPFPGSPSLGGGIGYAWADGHWSANVTQTQPGEAAFKKRHIKSSFRENGFAWQIIASLNFFACYDLDIKVEYRFFKLHDEISSHKFGLALVKFF